ncbi:hypothetical protein [Sagittula stellata]|nr:hypothetical protein [Sagittula stellata]
MATESGTAIVVWTGFAPIRSGKPSIEGFGWCSLTGGSWLGLLKA